MGIASDILRLTRIEHSLMLVVAVIAAELVTKGIPPLAVLVLSLVTPIFISMGSFAINDYFDIEVDRRNKRNRPLIRGSLSPRHALYITAATMAIGIASSALINLYAAAIAIAFAALALLYSYKLKELFFWGNAYVALSMVIPFIFGSYVVGTALKGSILLVSLMVFLSGLAREIHGTMRDYEGDVRIRNVHSIPKVVGLKGSAALALILYLAAIMLSIYMMLYVKPFRYNIIFAPMVLVSDIILVYVGIGSLYKRGTKFYSRVRNLSLIAMVIAIVAILIAPIAAKW